MKKNNIFENFILIAILLVTAQTFFEDYIPFLQVDNAVRNYLLYTGFFFDLLFTIEFIIRCLWAIKEKRLKSYILYQRGWIDFLASIPLLLLNSGPALFFYLKGAITGSAGAIGVLNTFKIIKAIRVTRILRLIRLLKIFGKIHNAESKMAQRHIASISTIGVFTIITILIFLSLFQFVKFDKLKEERIVYYQRLTENIENINLTLDVPLRPLIFKLLSNDNYILKLSYADFLIFSNISEQVFRKYFYSDDYFTVEKDEYQIYISLKDLNQAAAAVNLQNFIIILFLIIVYMVIYTKHFVQNISDVVHIMKRGLKEKDYNLEVKIHPEFADDEIYQLAEEYNNSYLPEKYQKQQEEKAKKATVLSMNDLLTFGRK